MLTFPHMCQSTQDLCSILFEQEGTWGVRYPLQDDLSFPQPVMQISFGAILTPIGVFLLTYGFGSFFQLLPGSSVAAILLIYGFPITLLGFALSYAQLKPVPCKTTKEALSLRDAQATDIQKQVTFLARHCAKGIIEQSTIGVQGLA